MIATDSSRSDGMKESGRVWGGVARRAVYVQDNAAFLRR